MGRLAGSSQIIASESMPSATQAEERQTDAPQHVQGAFAEAGQESHGQQVEEPFDESRDPVLRRSMAAAAMADLDLAHAKSAGVRQHRDETMQLAVDADLAQHLAAVELEAAVVVVQAAAGERAHQPVEYPAGINLVPGVVAGLLPAADDVIALFEPVEKPRDLGRIVLKVAVQGEDQVAPGCLKRGRERGGLAEVATESDCAHARVALPKARPGRSTNGRGCRRRRR